MKFILLVLITLSGCTPYYGQPRYAQAPRYYAMPSPGYAYGMGGYGYIGRW
jgi:hypothetical protein